MNFTREEKKACVFILMSLADCDGRRNREEIRMLSRCSDVLGISTDELLGGLLEEVSWTMNTSIVESIVKPMVETKKVVLEECMKKIMEADGPANDTEIGTWWSIQMNNDLPTWISRKNSN